MKKRSRFTCTVYKIILLLNRALKKLFPISSF